MAKLLSIMEESIETALINPPIKAPLLQQIDKKLINTTQKDLSIT